MSTASELERNMRTTAETFVLAFNGAWHRDATLAQRAHDCEHVILPTSLGYPKRNKQEWAANFKNIQSLILDSKMTIDDYMAVPGEQRAVVRSSMTATTPAGKYDNEYVWWFTFDETGTQIVQITEYVDSVAVQDLRRRIKEAGLHLH